MMVAFGWSIFLVMLLVALLAEFLYGRWRFPCIDTLSIWRCCATLDISVSGPLGRV